jgi:hypothetical protein
MSIGLIEILVQPAVHMDPQIKARNVIAAGGGKKKGLGSKGKLPI